MVHWLWIALVGGLVLWQSEPRLTAAATNLYVPEFSPETIALQWEVADENLTQATPMFFARPAESATAGWEKISVTYDQKTHRAFFKGRHKQTWQFRSAIADEVLVLGDFNHSAQLKRMNPAVLAPNHKMTIGLNRETAAEGAGSLRFSFIYNGTQTNEDFHENVVAGISFNKQIETYDWSAYRYIEFVYCSDIPKAVRLYISTDLAKAKIPLFRYSKNGGAPDAWQPVVVDLNEALGPPETRKKVNMCVFMIPLQEVDFSQEHYIGLDAVYLWQHHNIVQTTVDATPPSIPQNLQAKWLNAKRARVSWEVSEEDVSGIAGYSYVFTPSLTQQPPGEIVLQETNTEVPVKKRNHFQRFYLRVKAQNGASLWSETANFQLPYSPNKFE